MKEKDRIVFRTDDGQWADKRVGASRPAALYPTQKQAIAAAREHLENQGGGELSIKGLDGRIRKKDTVPPGNDPMPPQG